MTVELTITSITVQPEISAANVVITPTFSSGGGLTAPILSISKNGVNIAPDELKNVDIEVPTKTSELTNDSDFVSDANYVHTDNNYDNAAVAEVAKIADKANSADVYTKSETYSQTEINNKLSAVYKFKGSVLTYDLLPIDAENADVWNVVNGITPELNGMNYAWNSTLSSWDAIGGIVGLATLTENGLMSKEDFKKLSDLYTKEDLDLILADKSPTSHRHDGETIIPDVVEFQTPASIPTAIGSTYYDAANKVISTILDGAVLQNGLEIYVRVVNKTGVQINDGQAVYISGAQGNRPTATLAKADAALTSEVIGVATMNIPNNQEGFVTVFGSVDYNTTGITDGAELYLSGTVAGALTEAEPTFPLHKVVVATALNSTNNGKIFVRPYHIFELAELHGVDLTETTPLDTDSVLIQQTATGKVKKTLFSTLKTFLSNLFYTKTLSDRKFVDQNGGTIYHITRWFTPTSALTIAANGLSATITSRQFTSAMTGAKLKLTGGVNEPIITYVSTNQINLSFAVDASFFGQSVAVADWGVYNYIVGTHNSGNIQLFNAIGQRYQRFDFLENAGGGVFINYDSINFPSSGIIRFSNSGNATGTKDLGVRRISDGLMEIYNGVTNGVLRDLKLRSLYADKIMLNALNTAPSSATDTGTTGEVRITSDYIYVCTSTNTWKRTPLTTW